MSTAEEQTDSVSELDESTPIHQVQRTASRTIDGKAVVIVIDAQKLHTLNSVGTRIWELADGRTLGDIADAIVSEFEVDRDTALADSRKFVAQMRDIGAIEIGVK
jgi:hypothetical protein